MVISSAAGLAWDFTGICRAAARKGTDDGRPLAVARRWTARVGVRSGPCRPHPPSRTRPMHGGVMNNQKINATGGTLQVEGKCFDAPNHVTANNTIVEIWSCNGGANQKFAYQSNGTIVGSESGKCVTVQGASTSNGAKLILYTCNGGSNQKWTRQ
jgi:Ricin-type beta-trefoil lectin domain